MIIQDLEHDNGLALLDPHGDLVEAVLPFVPSRRVNQVLYFAPADRDWPIAFNVFRQGNRMATDTSLLASQLITTFRKQWADSWGPRLEHILRVGILAIAPLPQASLLFLYTFLTNNKLLNKIAAKIADPVVKAFWTKEWSKYPANLQGEALSPVLNKLGAFVSSPLVRNIVAQEKSKVDLIEHMNRRGILLANLSTGAIGEDASSLLGGLLLTSLQLAAMERPRHGPSFYIYADEFQNFASDSLSTMLAESRKYGLGLILAHQYLAQLPESLRDAVLGNVGSQILFRVGGADALLLEQEFAPPFSAYDLQNLPNYHAAVKLLARGEALAPFSARTIPTPKPPAEAAAIVAKAKEASRAKFAEPRSEVERLIHASMTAKASS